jgi:ATP-dependent helicase/DNAse subunit B
MTGLFTAKFFAGSYPAIRAELSQSILAETRRDPFGEKIILLPSNYVAEDISGGITRDRGKPIFNLQSMTLLDFARRLLKHRRMPFSEIDPMTRAVLLADVVRRFCRNPGETSCFEKIYRKKGFVSALLRLFDEFEEGMISGEEAHRLQRDPVFLNKFKDPLKIREILSLYRAYLLGVEEAGLKTRTHIVRLAADGFEVPGYPFRVRVFGFYDFTRLQWFLVEKLIASGLIEEVFFPLPTRSTRAGSMTIDNFDTLKEIVPEGFQYARDTFWRFLRQFDGNVTILDDKNYLSKSALNGRTKFFHGNFDGSQKELPFALISAPHAPGELRCVARLIKEEIERETAGKKIGLIYRSMDERLVPDIERVFREFAIPHALAWSRPLARTSPVRTILGLLKLSLSDYPRRETVDTLTSPCFDLGKLHPEGEKHAALWDHVTKKTAITGGADWAHKLQIFVVRGKKAIGLGSAGNFEEPDEADGETGRPPLLGREIASAEALKHCVALVKETLEPLRGCDSYSGLATFILSLLKRFILVRGEEEARHFQERVLKRTTRIIKTFGELDWRKVPFSDVRNAISLLEQIFQEERVPHHPSGSMRGGAMVLAGDITALRGIIFDHIYLLGVNDGSWPLIRKEVSLLKDEERELFRETLKARGLPPPLERIRDNLPEEKLLFTLPFIMCRAVKALSFQRSDMAGTRRVPSPLLTDLIYRFRGPDIFLAGLNRDTVGKGMIEFPRQLRQRFRAPGEPSKRELLISSLMKIPCGGAEAELSAPARRTMGRAAETLSRWHRGEGLAPDPKSVAALKIPEGKLNHTFLEHYISCPYRTYLRYGLKLEPHAEPEEVFSLGRREMGIVVHRALYLLYKEKAGDSSVEAVEEAVRLSIEEYGRNNPAGLAGLREITAGNLAKTISDYLAWEKETPTDLSPEWFEMKFGFEGAPDIFVHVGTEPIPISGKIDRIDRRGGTIQVIDYKLSAGYKYTFMEEKISLGILNQIPLYGIAAKGLLIKEGISVQNITGGYAALKGDGRKGYHLLARLDEEGEMLSRWKESLLLLLEGLKSGLFPPMADKYFTLARWKENYCSFCDYADLCRVAPMTRGNESIARSLSENFPALFSGLTWHRKHRRPSG